MTPSPDRENNREQNENPTEIQCRLVTRDLCDLHPHPSYVKHRFSVSADAVTALSAAGESVIRLPIIVTRTGIIIDGYARWELARQQGRETIACLEYDLSDEDALRWLIQSHKPSKGLTGYCRALLALDLEPSVREGARANQQIGGQRKGSSDLTEAQKVDVRAQIAAVANVSTGSLTKTKQIVEYGAPVIQDATKSGEIRVHRAWQWCRLSHHRQLEKLEKFRSCKGVGNVSRKLIQQHVARMAPTQLIPTSLGAVLEPLIPVRVAVLDEIVVSEIDAPGRIAYFTKGAIGVLRSREEPQCKTATC